MNGNEYTHDMFIDLIGKIWIRDILVFYDEPLVYTCSNAYGNLFIANCSDQDDKKKEWLFLPITEARLIKGLKGNISVYDLFSKPEGDFLWKVYEFHNQAIATAVQIYPEQLTEDNLPDKKAYFNVLEEEYCPRNENKIMEDSLKERRDILDVSLEVNDVHEHELPTEIIGKTLCNIQKMIYYIADKRKGSFNNILKEVIENNELSFIGTKAASLRIRFKSKNIADVLNDTPVRENLDIFIKLLKCKEDCEGLKSTLNTISTKACLKYREFLSTLVKGNIGIKVFMATPKNEYKEVTMSAKEMVNSLSVLDNAIEDKTEIYECIGDLTAADSLSKTFTFIPMDEDTKKIKGKISEQINRKEYVVPSKNIWIKLEEKVRFNSYTKKEEIYYTLMQFIDK